MPEARRVGAPNVGQWERLLQQNEKTKVSSFGIVKFITGRYGIKHTSQDEATAYFPHGQIHGLWKASDDIQSDVTFIPIHFTPKDTSAASAVIAAVWRQIAMQSEETWKAWYNSNTEVLFEDVAILEPVDEHEPDTVVDDVSQWSSARLASAILQPDAETNMPLLREMILVAEDTSFSVEENKQLAFRLLSFAVKLRDSNDPQDGAAVWSAIRTGASMLRPNFAEQLCPLLEPGHSIETSMVTVKMLGRIFEAQPPAEVDEHQALANEIFEMANSLLNRYAIALTQNAAIAQLAIYALAAMASSKIDDVVKKVHELNMSWFTQQIVHEFSKLARIWASRIVPIADPPKNLLDNVIQALKAK